jgi:hypothetical protein
VLNEKANGIAYRMDRECSGAAVGLRNQDYGKRALNTAQVEAS